MGFFRQEYWGGLPFPSPGDLPDQGLEPRSPTLQADTLPSEPPEKPIYIYICCVYYVEVCSLYTHFVENYFNKWMLNLVKRFSTSIGLIIWFLSFINPINTLIDLQISNHSCMPQIIPILSWCMILLMYFWIWFANILLRFFASTVLNYIGLYISVFCGFLFWFCYQGAVGLAEWICKVLVPSGFGTVWEG